MRALRLVVSDIARAMRRQGRQALKGGDPVYAYRMGTSLISYADLLSAATKRPITKKAATRGGTRAAVGQQATASERRRLV